MPSVGVLIEDVLMSKLSSTLRQHFIHFVLAEDRPKRGLCELARRVERVGDLDDGLRRIDDAK